MFGNFYIIIYSDVIISFILINTNKLEYSDFISEMP